MSESLEFSYEEESKRLLDLRENVNDIKGSI